MKAEGPGRVEWREWRAGWGQCSTKSPWRGGERLTHRGLGNNRRLTNKGKAETLWRIWLAYVPIPKAKWAEGGPRTGGEGQPWCRHRRPAPQPPSQPKTEWQPQARQVNGRYRLDLGKPRGRPRGPPGRDPLPHRPRPLLLGRRRKNRVVLSL